MENKKWLYFRKEVDMANDNGTDDSLLVPASSLVSMSPSSDTALTLTFSGVLNNEDYASAQTQDTVVLTVIEGDMNEAMVGISQAINSNPHSDGFIVIADDCVTTDGATGSSPAADTTIASQYVHPSITACVSINVRAFGPISASVSTVLPSMVIGGATTVTSNALELAVNTNYHALAAAHAITIPSAAAGAAGDWITVIYSAVVANGDAHTYTTTTDASYAAGSLIRRIGGGVASFIDIANGTSDNVMTLTGATNGDMGIGTSLRLLNTTGDTDGWVVYAEVINQGDGSGASSGSVFS